MHRRFVIATAVLAGTATVALGGATLAFGGPGGLIFDDGHYAKPGALDDGKVLLPQTKITLAQAVADAQKAAPGPLGQVDLEQQGSRVVYVVDVVRQAGRSCTRATPKTTSR